MSNTQFPFSREAETPSLFFYIISGVIFQQKYHVLAKTVILFYNNLMKKKCNTNPVVKYFRILLSLTVIGLGIYYKTWLGLIGIITLISAFTGDCALSLKFNRPTRYQFKLDDKEDGEKDDEKNPGEPCETCKN